MPEPPCPAPKGPERMGMPVPPDDVPTTLDFRDAAQAAAWTASAPSAMPARAGFQAAIVEAVAEVIARRALTIRGVDGEALRRVAGEGAGLRLLELGAGPGLLLAPLLTAHPGLQAVALDFSAAMHALARERLGPLSARVQFVERDLRSPHWGEGLGRFDLVVSFQTVHELRHRRHALPLHAQTLAVMAPGGVCWVCDQVLADGPGARPALHLAADEQAQVLRDAGFVSVTCLRLADGLVLHEARRA